jgi:hypothetical protein
MTHRALVLSDFSSFAGWHFKIDEVPGVLDRGDLRTATLRTWLEHHYHLEPIRMGWSSITLTRAGWDLAPSDFEKCDSNFPLRGLHERVTLATEPPLGLPARHLRRAMQSPRRQAVIVNIDDWREVEDGRTWSWWSLFSPRMLQAAASVEFLANNFSDSFSCKMWRALDRELIWNERTLLSARPFAVRPVTVRYFAQDHVASATFFESDVGKNALGLVASHLSTGERIWMANSAWADDLVGLSGERLSPRKAGSNAYAGYHEAACIYSAKPSPETRNVMALFDVDPESWTATHEYETILQFACRTSIRDPRSAAPLTFYVYDAAQADYLCSYLRKQPHVILTMELVDLGFANHRANRGGGSKKQFTEDEARERKRERMREQRAKAKLSR